MTMMNKSIAALLSVAVLSSCDYEKNAVQDITGVLPAAKVRFFNFSVGSPSVNFYANDTKMTATLTATCSGATVSDTCKSTGAEATTGVVYGGAGGGGFYSGIEPGQYALTGRIAATIDKDLAISTTSANIESGKNYSLYLSDFYNTATKTTDAFLIEDQFPAEFDWTAADVRFVHAISNANPMTLYARQVESGIEYAIGGEVAYKGATGFTKLPNGSYTLRTAYAGATTNAMSRVAVSFAQGAVYTITARGDILTAPTTTGCATTNRTCLDYTPNR